MRRIRELLVNENVVPMQNHPGVGSKFPEMLPEQIENIHDDFQRGEPVFVWDENFYEEQKRVLEMYDGKMTKYLKKPVDIF